MGLISCLLTSCLRTRAPLQPDTDEGVEWSKPIPVASIKPVEPLGRYALDEVKEELTRLGGRLEDLERTQAESEKEKKNQISQRSWAQLEERVSHLEKTLSTMTDQLDALGEKVSLLEPEDFLSQAREFYKKGNYARATELLGKYLKSPQAKKREEALWLRGESFFKLKEYKKSIVEFSRLTEKYASSSKTPWAIYKIGLCFDELGLKEDAKGFYRELIQKFPQSPEAKKAKEKIKKKKR